jgi:hypothetical protein
MLRSRATTRSAHSPSASYWSGSNGSGAIRCERPSKTFIPLRDDAICEYMKTITLPKLYRALRDDVYEVHVDEPSASKARLAIERMIAVTRPMSMDAASAVVEGTTHRR